MADTPETKALESWLRDNGGYLHPSVHILQDAKSGVHMRATNMIAPATIVAAAPHSLALSYLNALVDDGFPVFKQHRDRFKVEAIGFFYLMAQYINREQSFWKPYLDTLPGPEGELTQPLFFEHADDVAWVDGTDVWHTITARKGVYEKYYADGITILQKAGFDVEPYTWHLFKWAITTYTSRSFSSRSLRPQSGKYWAAYKSPSTGARQAVLLDMLYTTAEDLHFPVLFPGLDSANHSHDAKVDWTFDPGRFTVALAKAGESEGIKAGDEAFNNYGPKSNGELLIGYGFCIENNPHDTVAMTLKAPPNALQDELRIVHAGYFTELGQWNAQKGTFQLKKPSITLQTSSGLTQRPQIFHQLPEPLLELLLYTLRHERGLPFELQEHPLAYLTDLDSSGRRYLPHIARMIVQSLAPKLAKLQSSTPDREPQNKKQHIASIYRKSQINILQSLITALKTYTRALMYRPPSLPLSNTEDLPRGPKLITLEAFINLLQDKSILHPAFLRGIAANAGTADLTQLRLAGWEEDIWVLMISWLLLDPDQLPTWLRDAFGEYIDTIELEHGTPITIQPEAEGIIREDEQAADLLPVIQCASASTPGAKWEDPRWSPDHISSTGGAVMKYDSFLVLSPINQGQEDGEEARLFVYFHFP